MDKILIGILVIIILVLIYYIYSVSQKNMVLQSGVMQPPMQQPPMQQPPMQQPPMQQQPPASVSAPQPPSGLPITTPGVIDFKPPPPKALPITYIAQNMEVFCVIGPTNADNPNGYYPLDYMKQVMQKIPSTIATLQQLTIAWTDGAQWCRAGFVADKDICYYPIQEGGMMGCGPVGVNSFDTRTWGYNKTGLMVGGINLYGVKPPGNYDVSPYKILPFSLNGHEQWSKFKD